MTADYLFLMLGCYALTAAVEMSVLLLLLSRRHSAGVAAFAGAWLIACTYPVVWLVLPPLLDGEPRWVYLLVAECAVFWFAFVRGREPDRDAARLRRDRGGEPVLVRGGNGVDGLLTP